MPTPTKLSWPGHYFDGKTPARHPVTVRVVSGGLYIVREEGPTLWWNYEEIRRTQGDNPGEPIRFEKGGELPEVVVVDDPEFLAAVEQVGPTSSDQLFRLTDARGRSRWVKVALTAGVASVIVGWLIYVWGIPALADQAAARIPVSWEEQLGDSAVESMVPAKLHCTDTEKIEIIEGIVEKLIASVPESPYTFQVTVVKGEMVNAFAAPGGRLVIYEGLLKKTDNAEELAGVLAHEIQHCLYRHPTRALFRRASVQVMLSVLLGGEEAMGNIMEFAALLGEMSYSRDAEEEADREGFRLIQAAKADPEGMVSFMQKLGKGKGQIPKELQYFSTHPHTADRVAMLKELAAKIEYAPVPLVPGYAWKQMYGVCESTPGLKGN